MISFPNAKINLGLDVIARRNDGYHNISSCFYPIPLKDILEINLSNTFSFNKSGLQIPGDQGGNLVVKAYKILKKDFDLPPVAIHLHKNIPMQSGLGGGSSDGAYTLRMLNELFELFLDDSVISDYASMLGSDCPFFIYNVPSIITGRGEEVEEIDLDLNGYIICVVKLMEKSCMQKRNRTVWHLEVPPHLNEQLEDYIEKDTFKTKSEFIRTAVRDRLREEFERLGKES